MLELGLVFAAMCAVAILIVVIPVLRARASVGVERSAVNARIFQERLSELESDLKEQRIDADEFAQLKLELEKTLLADVDPNAQVTSSAKSSLFGEGRARVVIALAVIIPALSAGCYFLLGSAAEVSDWLNLQTRMNFMVDKALTGSQPTAEEAKDVTLADFIRVAQKKLQQDESNPIGWMLLGMSYLQVEMPNEAQDALQHAYELAPQNPEIQMGYAQALVATNEGKLNPQSNMLLQQLLANRPNHPQALMVLGMASFNAGEYQHAIDAWQKLLAIRNDDSEGAQIVRRSIDMAQQRLANPQPAATELAANQAGASITVTVNLDPALQSKLQATDLIFVFAKAASGPPMPLAVHRQVVGTFPLTVELNDAKAMNEALKLSKFPKVIVSARISHSGQAIGQAGDLQGASGVIDVASQKEPVNVTIQEEIK